ncbi:MAG: response regulator [Cyclobacteriaceae bacterium]|nr:response regulator [Cyclobacteriaceae bacterium]
MTSSKPLVLCVDDEPVILSALNNQLRRYFNNHLTIETASSGEEGIEILDELLSEGRDVEVIVSDQLMPGIKGDEFLTLSHERAPRSLKILLTGYASLESVGNAINHANLYRFIGKPWQEDDLGITVREAINVYWREKLIAEQNETLKTLNHELEQKVRERTRELLQKNEALEESIAVTVSTQRKLIQSEKMAALGQLVAGVAHEVNTPLGVIKSSIGYMIKSYDHILRDFTRILRVLKAREMVLFLRMIELVNKEFLTTKEERDLRQKYFGWFAENGLHLSKISADCLVEMNLPANLEKFLPLFRHERAEFIIKAAHSITMHEKNAGHIKLAADKADKIIFALKSHSRMDQTDSIGRIDLARNIETVLILYHNQVKQGVEVIKKYPASVVQLDGYADELSQVWTNLIHNSLYAMQNKGKLTIEIIDSHPEEVQVNVTDNGPGIPDEIKDKIFNPFFTTKPVGEGSGLGLEIISRIVEKHMGRIELESTVGVGTTFKVFLKRSHK